MAWPSIPYLILTDSVRAVPVTGWTGDAAGARVPAYGAASAPIPCSVTTHGAETAGDHRRQGMKSTHTVTFVADPGVPIRSQLLWAEGNRTLTVVGIVPAGDANGRIWEYECEEWSAV